MKLRGTWLVVGLLVACGESSGTQELSESAIDSGESMPESADAFGESTPVPDGYTRYYSTVQTLGPGESTMLVEWVAPAFDEDMDVLDVSGGQTNGGHHALLYATAVIEEVGTVRPLDTEDQLVARSFGGPGGEGMDLRLLDLPEDYAFRLRKGEGLYIQSHYINVTEDTIDVRSYIDAKLAKPSGERTIITSFTNATVENELAPASSTETTVECVTQSDLKLVVYSNHMHEYGKSVSTEAELPDGTRLMIKDDPVWTDEWQTNPNYSVTFDESTLR